MFSAASLETHPPQLPVRSRDAHKGDCGRVLLIGGSRGMAGAISLSGLAALRSGAGLVTLAVPNSIADLVAGFHPAYMTAAIQDDKQGRIDDPFLEKLEPWIANADVVAVGPGLGRTTNTAALVERLLERAKVPVVIDADALLPAAISKTLAKHSPKPRVLTPHVGELQRLVSQCGPDRGPCEAAAIQIAQTSGAVVLLKGAGTLVTNGQRHYRNSSGNPGMATAGAGDVLTGIIAALIGQKMPVFEAAALGAHLHGVAGDIAAALGSQYSLIATDLIDSLPLAFQREAELPSAESLQTESLRG